MAVDDEEPAPSRRRRRAPQLLFLLESWGELGEDDVFGLLASTEAFADVPPERLGDLLALLEPRHVAAGTPSSLKVTSPRASTSSPTAGCGSSARKTSA